MIIVLLITLIYAFFRAFHFTYLFQIKEYRFDRLFSYIREQGFLQIFYTSANRRPAFSFRNILILLFLCTSLGLSFLLALEKKSIYYGLILMLPFAPLISFAIVGSAVIITEIPAKLYRYLIIGKAILKVRRTNTIFIGITGTYGKTSVKEYVSFILASKFSVAKTDKNMNTGVGIAIGINKNLTENTNYFVTEVGSYKRGETKQATWYIPFKYGILTGLGNQHIDLYGSRKNLIQEETSLLSDIQPDGITYINNVPDINTLLPTIYAKKITYGLHHSDMRAKIISMRQGMTKARVNYRGYEFTIETQLPGEHSVLNLLPAIAISMDCGLKSADIVQRIKQLRPVEGKLSVHTGKAKATILNDAVNSNVEGFVAALAVLREYPQKTKYVISQGIIELGVEKRSSYEKILAALYNTHAKLLTIDNVFKELDTKQSVMIFNDVLQLRDKIVSLMNKHTVILLEGKLPEDVKKSIMN